MKDLSERKWYEECLDGKNAAWKRLRDFVFRLLRYKLRSEQRAEEFCQQILLQLLERDRSGVLNLTKCRDPNRFSSFLRAFTFSHMIDLIRADDRRTRGQRDFDAKTIRLPRNPGPEARAELVEELNLRFAAISRVSEPCRTILRQDLQFRSGLTDFQSYGELFESIRTLEAVKTHRKESYNLDKFYVDLHRCRKYLMRQLQKAVKPQTGGVANDCGVG